MSNEISGGTRVTVHFHGGTTAVTTITDDDAAAALEELNSTRPVNKPAAETLEDLIEAVFAQPGKPRFQWLGDIFLHPQAVTGVELLDLTI